MNEGNFYRNHVGPRLGKYGHICRIENALESGTPDINYAIDGTQGWIETKIIRDEKLTYQRFQIPWMKKRLRSCSEVWVLAATEDLSYIELWPARVITEAPRTPYRKWVQVQVSDLPTYLRLTKPFDWDEIARHLRDGPFTFDL